MRNRYKNSFRNKILDYLVKLPGTVILRRDVEFLGSPRQVSRGLNALIEDGMLIRLGAGIYVKAEQSEYLGRPVIQSGFTDACIEALERLGVRWEPSQELKNYNEGKSKQVPARFEIRLKSRFRRKLAYGNRILRIEGMIYAK